jgi:hypothetical protein
MSDRDLRELERKSAGGDPEAAKKLARENCRIGEHVYIFVVMDYVHRELKITLQSRCKNCGRENEQPLRRIYQPRKTLGWNRPLSPYGELRQSLLANKLLQPFKMPEMLKELRAFPTSQIHDEVEVDSDDCAIAMALAAASWKKIKP